MKVGTAPAIGIILAIEQGENRYLLPRYLNDGYFRMILWLGLRFVYTTFRRMAKLDKDKGILLKREDAQPSFPSLECPPLFWRDEDLEEAQ